MKIKNLHRWDVTTKEAIDIQLDLRERFDPSAFTEKAHLIAGADAAYSKKEHLVHGVVSVFSFPGLELIERRVATLPLTFPYVPGLLTFREGPVLLECFKKLKSPPDLIIFDGQGVAHPRGMGIATHLGILLDTPSIGCAKSRLYGEFLLPSNLKGEYEYIEDRERGIIGACLRTRDNVKPVFVSVGYRIGLSKAMNLVLKSTTVYRLPEPLRDAHKSAEDAKSPL